jgi:hypothetical protein
MPALLGLDTNTAEALDDVGFELFRCRLLTTRHTRIAPVRAIDVLLKKLMEKKFNQTSDRSCAE